MSEDQVQSRVLKRTASEERTKYHSPSPSPSPSKERHKRVYGVLIGEVLRLYVEGVNSFYSREVQKFLWGVHR